MSPASSLMFPENLWSINFLLFCVRGLLVCISGSLSTKFGVETGKMSTATQRNRFSAKRRTEWTKRRPKWTKMVRYGNSSEPPHAQNPRPPTSHKSPSTQWPRNGFTQFALEDSVIFGPNPWKILAPPSNYLSNIFVWATQPLAKILDSEFLLCELGVRENG